jgi:hypothetical protein
MDIIAHWGVFQKSSPRYRDAGLGNVVGLALDAVVLAAFATMAESDAHLSFLASWV